MEFRLTIYPSPQRLPILANKRASIIVKSHNHPILPLHLLLRSHYDGVSYIASLDLIRRSDTSGTTCPSQAFPQ